MQALTEKLVTIESKVKLLAQKLEEVQKINAAFEKENKQLKTDLAVLLEKGSQVVATSVTAPVVANLGGEKQLNTKKLKKEIDQYIKEINKCIEWLQNT